MSKVLIKDIPPLGWGISGETSFIASINNIMKTLDKETDYYELMGISGAAFRMQFSKVWCPSSGDWYDRSVVTQHLGFRTKDYMISEDEDKGINKAEARNIIKKSLDSGLPVIGIDLRKVPEWGIICGYEGDTFYVRDYFDNKSDEYVPMTKFPWIIHILEELSESKSKKELILEQLQKVVTSFEVPFVDNQYHNGRAGFQFWIDQINDDEAHKDKFAGHWHLNGWLYDLLYDARNAAHMFLLNIADLFSGDKRDKLLEVREKYKFISEYICENWIHFPMPNWVEKEKEQTFIPPLDPSVNPEPRYLSTVEWTPEMRDEGKLILSKILEMEEEAIDLLKSFLDS
ncbi:MAG: hypothetical protein ACW98G_17085 [Candidatus Hodarchaeales archaeon]|jgi:hypothetical protein